MKVVIIGGVAGGASCAARLRRLDEKAEILMVERGPYLSFANCGLPYHAGGVIAREEDLLIANPGYFKANLNIEARINCEAMAVDPARKTVDLRDFQTGETSTVGYDKLVLATGAASVVPPIPGIDLPGIFQMRTVPDVRAVREWIEKGSPFLAGMSRYSGFQVARPKTSAVVVGGGFIGLEMAENLRHRGFDVTLIEMRDQLLAPVDPEMARIVEDHMKAHGVGIVLNDGVARFDTSEDGAVDVTTRSGKVLKADLVILALGVRPDTTLARAAGLEIGSLGGIRTDDRMTTSDPDILAVGDAVEVRDVVIGQWSLIALAGPANRQGRIAADVIAGRDSRYRGTQGTSIIGLFDSAIAWTGASEKALRAAGRTAIEKIYLYPNSHAGYYPGATPIAIKVIFSTEDRKVLGVQALGRKGVDKLVSTIAMAIQMGATVDDLAEAELCYAPQFGSAKDPVNFTGMVAQDVLSQDGPVTHWGDESGAFLLDVREAPELSVESVPGAVNIPLRLLRGRLGELPLDRDICVICRSGQRAYYAARVLIQHGYRASVISGGMLSRFHSRVLEA